MTHTRESLALSGARLSLCTLLVAGGGCIGQVAGVRTLDPDGGTATSPDAGLSSTGTTGLPCDVAQVLTDSCLQCHGNPLAGGAPVSLATLDALRGPSPLYPTQTGAERALVRMQATTLPMPPAPAAPATAQAIATIQAWVQGGYKPGSCGSPDGGANPYDTPVVCTSGQMWNPGPRVEGSANMNPGQACIACHSSGEGPLFAVAGTVYPSAHEPDDCNGAPGGNVTVVIQPAQGAAITLTPNAVGNFSYAGALSLPYTAKVISGGRERAMATPQTSGDCNSCHTESGANQAPGRIMLP